MAKLHRRRYHPDEHLAEVLTSKFPAFQAYLKNNPYIAKDLGAHAARRTSEVLDDALVLVDDPISKVNISVAVATMCISHALREACDAMRSDTARAVNIGPLLDEILGAIQWNIREALSDTAK